MTESNDELMDRLARLDPTRSDVSPVAGSPRFTSIKDGIMQTDETPADPSATTTGTATTTATARATEPRLSGSTRQRGFLVAMAAATVAVLAVGASVLAPGGTSSAEATVLAAAQNSAELTDFRMDMVSSDPGFFGGSATLEVDGQNAHLSAGDVEGYIIGETVWLSEDGGATFEVSQESPLHPYAEASSAVITAALTSNGVTEAGTETIRGTETTVYEITIDEPARAALAKLSLEETFWFVETTEMECFPGEEDGAPVEDCERRSGFLEDAESIAIWVADDLVHQIAVDSGSVQFTHTIYDLGADITVTAPE